mgnify:CR=1 FL=1
MNKAKLSNPFRGLCPFGPEEDYLFFGREQIVDQLLKRLRQTRFLAVIGSSGCGKSSLIQAGLIPSLYSGYMTRAGSSWRVAIMRPGADPIGNLAKALSHPDILGRDSRIEETAPVVNEATIIRSNYGLVDCIRLARVPKNENILIVVDQFEELFRFNRTHQQSQAHQPPQAQPAEQAREDAVAFVKRLTHAARQTELPIYIVLTMRSDFIGECNEYPGLPESINEGQFLVPRMTRTELRSAIVGPVKVGGANISPRLLVKLLNDVGDNPDRLPILQHALMRTWDYWYQNSYQSENPNEPIDLHHYQAIGTMEHALSSHADEVFEELGSVQAKKIAEKIFKSITDSLSDSRGVRHPTSLASLCLIAQADEKNVNAVINAFREAGRSFLMPNDQISLSPETIIDLSHESLMRVWKRLIRWIGEEHTSAQTYLRLTLAAQRYEQGTTGLWRDPELQIGLRWRELTQPSEAWAALYSSGFSRSMAFLEASKAERDRLAAEKRKTHRQHLQLAWGVSFILLVFAVYALIQQQRAEQEQIRAEQNFQLAVQAVDEMLGDVVVENSLANIPQTEALRQKLLEKTRRFYESLQKDRAADLSLQVEGAIAQVRLGKIYQLQSQPEKAEIAYQKAINQLSDLHEQFPDNPLIQRLLGEAYDWYGAQVMLYHRSKAEHAFQLALEYLQDLINRFPKKDEYQYELARVYNNQGILLGTDLARAEDAEKSFKRSISLFDGLRTSRGKPNDSWRLSRTQNGLGGLLRRLNRPEEAAMIYQEAIAIVTAMLEVEPDKREYKEGLARFYNNLGNLYLVNKQPNLALESNTKARQLFESLAEAIPELRSEIANSYNTQSSILRGLNRNKEASEAVEIAIGHYTDLAQSSPDYNQDPSFNNRFGGFLASFAILRSDSGSFEEAIELISRAIEHFSIAVNSAAPSSGYQRNLSNAYWLLADTHLKAGNHVRAESALALLLKINLDKNKLVGIARLYLRAVHLANSDSALVEMERADVSESYASKAVLSLGQAIKAGYSKAIIKKNAEAGGEFQNISRREDFLKILAIGVDVTIDENKSRP